MPVKENYSSVALPLATYMHGRKVKAPATVHFWFQIGILRLPDNHNSHNHGNGKCRTQYGNCTQQRILLQDSKSLSYGLHFIN
jgi:hypothetical protein